MMNNWKKIAILLVVLVAFAAAFIALSGSQKNTGTPGAASPTSTASTDVVKLLELTSDSISKIVLKNQEGDVVLTKTEKEVEKLADNGDGTSKKTKEKMKVWVTPGFDADTTAVNDMALAAETLYSKRLIDGNPKDLSLYGLDKASSITFVTAFGEEVTLEIGDKTPTGDSYYVRKSGSNAVYTIESYKGDTLSRGKLDIMSKNLYGTDALTADDVSALTFTKDGKKYFDSKTNAGSTDWLMTYPLERKIDYPDFSKFLDWLVALRVSEFVEEKPSDLKAYGLDEPKYVFEYTIAGKHYVLKLGVLKDSKYYACMEGDSRVFTVESSKLTFIDMAILDIVETFAYIPTIYDVEKLVIEIDGRVDTLLINAHKDDSEKDEFSINGIKVEGSDNQSLFKRYYQAAIAIMGDKLDLEAKPQGEAAIRLTYTMKQAGPAGKTVTVELIPTSDGYGYYIMKNGQYTGLVMGNRQLDKDDMGLRQSYGKLMDAIK